MAPLTICPHGLPCTVNLAGYLEFVWRVKQRADEFIKSRFGNEPFLAVHIRRGVDR